MENTNQVQQEKSQIFAEKHLYEMAELGNYDHKVDYEKGKDALLKKREYMPESDTLSKNESVFIAKYYPELINEFSSQFNWKEASSTVVQWAGAENIKKYFDRLDINASVDNIQKYEPELFEKLKNEINKKSSISYDRAVPGYHMNVIVNALRNKGFTNEDPIILSLEKLKSSSKPVVGKNLLETLAKLDSNEKESFMKGVEYNYQKALNIIKQAGLYCDEKSISYIKVNSKQSLRFPMFGKSYTDLKDNMELLLKGELTGLIEGFKTKDMGFDAKLKLEQNVQTGKLQIRHHRKAKELNVPEQLTEQEIAKLKNGEMLVLSRGFLFNYRYAKDKSALYLRNKIVQIKKGSAKIKDMRTTMHLDKELNKVIINYVIKENAKKASIAKTATVTANGDENPSIFLNEKKALNSEETKENIEVENGIKESVNGVKKAHEENNKDKDIRKMLGLETKNPNIRTKSIKP